ncbi:MAG: nitrate reductase, partial [Comamonadaceae bacterium]|nr:nitrate reductase [Comamonadaceae bacterium]
VLAGVNALTTSAYCPTSKQPELKHAAVKVLKAELPWSLLAMAWLPTDRALAIHAALRTLMPTFEFATCVPFGRDRTGVLFRAAAHDAPDAAVVEQLEALLGLKTTDALRYVDRRLGQRRTARLVRTGDTTRLEAFVLAGDTRAEAWIRPLLQDELPAEAYGRLLLMPGAKAPVAVVTRGKQVCTCFNVNEDDITAQLSACGGTHNERLATLQGRLRCGTNCGSCIPELRRLVRATPQALQVA